MSNTDTQHLEELRLARDYVVSEARAGRYVVSYQSESFTVVRGLWTKALKDLDEMIEAMERIVNGSGTTGGSRTYADMRNSP